MGKFIGFKDSKLSSELINNELIDKGFGSVGYKKRMAQVFCISIHWSNMKDSSDELFNMMRSVFTEEDEGFVPVRSLARSVAENINDLFDYSCFNLCGFTCDNQVICIKKRVNSRSLRT
ncbi:Os06g0205424 [Oryza sativa Japonica Group]|uniref:Os06g0205424 protein n=1 Tax=Oryza sativa subsp. japonica TaxID=39947 RepID=A0A0P0WUB7_ORYSJ|nr:Os06g0205424 [Oryza sativa Japonica Group]